MSTGLVKLDMAPVMQGLFAPSPEDTARSIIKTGKLILNVNNHPGEYYKYSFDNGVYPYLWTVEGSEKDAVCTLGHLYEEALKDGKELISQRLISHQEIIIRSRKGIVNESRSKDNEIIFPIYTEGKTIFELCDLTARRVWVLISEKNFNVEVSGNKSKWLRFGSFLVPIKLLIQTGFELMKSEQNNRKEILNLITRLNRY